MTALALVVALLVRPLPRHCSPLFLSVLAVLPWLPTPLPDLLLGATGPAVLFVWIGVVLAVALRWGAENGLQEASCVRDYRTAPWIAAAIACLAFLCVRDAATGAGGGDEPHYVVIAQSLLSDADIAVDNNYRQLDYAAYWTGPLTPHLSRPGRAGALYSVHAPGLAALVAPAFRVAGYWGVVVWLAAITAVGSAFVWKASYLLTGSSGAAWVAWATVGLTAPVVLHGALIYPDPVAGAILAVGTHALLVAGARSRPTAPWGAPRFGALHWAAVGLAIALLPWLHTRLALPALCLGALLLARLLEDARNGLARWSEPVALTLPLAASVVAWLGFFWVIYGTVDPRAPYGVSLPVDPSYLAIGAAGLAADQEFGLFPNAPVHLLALSGLIAMARRDLRFAVELVLIAAPYAVASASYPMWYGGASPPARFLIPIVFPAGVAVAASWATHDTWHRRAVGTMLVCSVLIASMLAFGEGGALAYNQGVGRARWLEWAAPLVDLTTAFPSYFRAGGLAAAGKALASELFYPAMVWGLVLTAGWVAFRLATRRIRETSIVAPLIAPVCLAATLAAGISVGWGRHGSERVRLSSSQLRLLRLSNDALLPVGVHLPEFRRSSAGAARAALAISSSNSEAGPDQPLLFLRDVPAGDYALRLSAGPDHGGYVFLGIGRTSGVAWRWSTQPGRNDTTAFRLPGSASTLVVNGDSVATQSITRTALVPLDTPRRAMPSIQLRDAVRFGQTVVFATDDRIRFDRTGFSILGERQPDVVFETDIPMSALNLAIRNVPASNRIEIRTGRWAMTRDLAPSEVWHVRIPALGTGNVFAVQFHVAGGVQNGEGFVGCHVELVNQ